MPPLSAPWTKKTHESRLSSRYRELEFITTTKSHWITPLPPAEKRFQRLRAGIGSSKRCSVKSNQISTEQSTIPRVIFTRTTPTLPKTRFLKAESSRVPQCLTGCDSPGKGWVCTKAGCPVTPPLMAACEYHPRLLQQSIRRCPLALPLVSCAKVGRIVPLSVIT